MSASAYFEQALQSLQRVRDTQSNAIRKASELLANAIQSGQGIYSFGASHSFILTEEMVYRAGGLMLINPIYPHGMNLSVRPLTATSRLERLPGLGAELFKNAPARAGDVLILASVSGRNAVIIDMAAAAHDKGLHTIGIVSKDYCSQVTSRHPSGKKLPDFCDIIIDNCVPLGDSAVAIEGFPEKVAPLSSVTGCAIVNAMVAETVSLLVQRGIEPPVFMSANRDGGDAYNARLLDANRNRIHYL